MPKRAAGPILTGLHLDRTLPNALHRQLYEELRQAILMKRLSPGERLPSTRTLADELGVSRRTVLEAFLQLYAEGYVDGRVGSGTYIARVLPDDILRPVSTAAHSPITEIETPRFSQRFQEQRTHTPPYLFQRLHPREVLPEKTSRAFMLGIPALDQFPDELWGRLVAKIGREIRSHADAYQRPAGYGPLREAVASYLTSARGVRCTADQVIILSGSQQAISLVAHVLLDPGDAAWVEEPGYFGAKGALAGAGARLVPVPVDADGLDVAAGRARCSSARLAYVTPSHQMPLGVTMSLARRLALLDWAREAGAWVIEDDYDSEYRYSSRPLASLQSLDTWGRVIYTGTFSKVLFPALRLGYLVAPPALVEAITTARLLTDSHSPLLEQRVVTEFIREGYFERHIRRMRALYAERQGVLVEAARREMDGLLEVAPAEGGMHLTGRLPAGMDDQQAQQVSQEHGVRALALSNQYYGEPDRNGLLLGYAVVPPPDIVEGVRRLKRALSSLPPLH